MRARPARIGRARLFRSPPRWTRWRAGRKSSLRVRRTRGRNPPPQRESPRRARHHCQAVRARCCIAHSAGGSEIRGGLGEEEDQQDHRTGRTGRLSRLLPRSWRRHSAVAQDDRESENAVRLMTVHGAKGLEFPHVFILRANLRLPHFLQRDAGRLPPRTARSRFLAASRRQDAAQSGRAPPVLRRHDPRPRLAAHLRAAGNGQDRQNSRRLHARTDREQRLAPVVHRAIPASGAQATLKSSAAAALRLSRRIADDALVRTARARRACTPA